MTHAGIQPEGLEPFRWLPDGWLAHQPQPEVHTPESLPWCLVCNPTKAMDRLHDIALAEAPRSTTKPMLAQARTTLSEIDTRRPGFEVGAGPGSALVSSSHAAVRCPQGCGFVAKATTQALAIQIAREHVSDHPKRCQRCTRTNCGAAERCVVCGYDDFVIKSDPEA